MRTPNEIAEEVERIVQRAKYDILKEVTQALTKQERAGHSTLHQHEVRALINQVSAKNGMRPIWVGAPDQ